MIKNIIRGAIIALAALALTLGPAASAQARTLSSAGIGTISGEYWVAGKNFDGSFRPYWSDECVDIQRKAGGVWRDNVSTTAPGSGWHCSPGTTLSWWIHDDTLAVNTDAIRMISDEGSILVLCTSRVDCQQM